MSIGWLTNSTEHRRIADVVQLDYYQIVSTVSVKKRPQKNLQYLRSGTR